MKTIQIVSTPAGEAPEWVRQAWVGLDLPCTGARPATYATRGVTAAPPSFWQKLRGALGYGGVPLTGYCVPAVEAVDALAMVNPEAAAWWRDNTPQLLTPGQAFLFEKAACKASGADSNPP